MYKQRRQRKGQRTNKNNAKEYQRYRSEIQDPKIDKEGYKKGSRQIKKQKISIQKTLEDQIIPAQQQITVNAPQTPQHFKTEKQELIRKYNNLDVDSFKMDESYQNKHQTIKKEYFDSFRCGKKEIKLERQEITLNPAKNINKQPVQIQLQKQIRQEKSGNSILKLKNGWIYKGQYSSNLFDGYGELYHQDRLIYSGSFQYGYFQGYGKLQSHQAFEHLVKMKQIKNKLRNQQYYESFEDCSWKAYFGQFHKGNISGFGQLWLSNGQKFASRWYKGLPNSKTYLLTPCSQK